MNSLQQVQEALQQTPTHLVNTAILVTAVLVATLVGLRLTRYYLNKLAKRNVLTAKLTEQMYTPIEAVAYTIAVTAVVYILTGLHEVLYIIVVVVAALLFSNWRVLSDITAYYLIVSQYNIRSGDIVEIPNLGIKGKIVRLGLLAATVRTNEGATIVVPNSILLHNPIRHLSVGQARIIVEVAITLPRGMENTIAALSDAENKLKEALVNRKIAHRPQDVTIVVKEVEASKAVFQVSIPIPGAEARHHNINTIAKALASELASYDPRIVVKAYEV